MKYEEFLNNVFKIWLKLKFSLTMLVMKSNMKKNFQSRQFHCVGKISILKRQKFSFRYHLF